MKFALLINIEEPREQYLLRVELLFSFGKKKNIQTTLINPKPRKVNLLKDNRQIKLNEWFQQPVVQLEKISGHDPETIPTIAVPTRVVWQTILILISPTETDSLFPLKP